MTEYEEDRAYREAQAMIGLAALFALLCIGGFLALLPFYPAVAFGVFVLGMILLLWVAFKYKKYAPPGWR